MAGKRRPVNFSNMVERFSASRWRWWWSPWSALASLIYWVVPGIPLIPAFALAAVLSPTDAVALSGIVGEGRIPKKIMGILQGEALMNDASARIVEVCRGSGDGDDDLHRRRCDGRIYESSHCHQPSFADCWLWSLAWIPAAGGRSTQRKSSCCFLVHCCSDPERLALPHPAAIVSQIPSSPLPV